ncbi:UDP-glucuronosyltransferase 2C1-like [Polymixia lowei]
MTRVPHSGVPHLVLRVLLVLLLCSPRCVPAGKVLIWPGEFSHWMNMKSIVDELHSRGHQITVMTFSASPFVGDEASSDHTIHNVHVLQVPFTKQEMTEQMDEMLRYWTYDMVHDNIIQATLKVMEMMDINKENNLAVCRALMSDTDLLERLKQEKFDVLLSDPMMMCYEILAEMLEVPLVLTLRFSFGSILERHCGQMPAPPSYVPAVGMGYTDQMDFKQRIKNLLFYASQDVMFELASSLIWDRHLSEFLGRPTSICEMVGKADIWLIRTYWDFEYPRPFPPNFKFVGGLHCKPAKPLPADMEEFVQSSGDHGIVVFSLGSMVKNMTKERTNIIATALGQIPQKVLWRYSGEKPDFLAPNTRVYDWIPQNDLLGHPKTKAFITHGGTNGLYEAIYHAVPIVGMPLFADQPHNIEHMKNRGAAVMLDINKMTSEDIVDALKAVTEDPSYKGNMTRLSRIHHDQPLSPLDTAVFWIEFVMRNKGAKHLRVQAHHLNWFQYHSLDVAAFLLAMVLVTGFILFKMGSVCIRRCCMRSRRREKTD